MAQDKFDPYEYDDVVELIPNVTEEWFLINKAYIHEKDYWQEGEGWSGPRLDSAHPLASESLDRIQTIFVVEDVLQEIVDRHVQGVAGSSFTWAIVPAEGTEEGAEPPEELVAQATGLLTAWIQARNPQEQLKQAIASALWSERGPLRLYVPNGLRDDSGAIPPADLPISIMRIFLESPSPEQSTVHPDPDTKDELGIYTYVDPVTEEDVAELVYLDDPNAEVPMTILRVTGEAGAAVPVDLGGRLTIHEITRDRMITGSLVSNQKKVNHAATAEQSNLATAGWVARLILNGQMPGDYQRDSEGEILINPATGEPTFVADPQIWGPNTVNYVVGVTTQDEAGNEKVANPSYVREEPSSPETFIKTKERTRAWMLARAQQAHIALNDQAAPSGESRIRARGDFEASLTTTKERVDSAIVWMLETVLQMAATFSGSPETFNAIRVSADAQIDLGAVTPAERAAARDMYEAGLISKRTALSWIGIDDVEGEIAQIELEGEDPDTEDGSTENGGNSDE